MRAGGDAEESSIELVGDRPLSFTTLKLRSPPRVVVDFAETDLALPVRDLAVDDGTIRRVAAAPAGQKTARVVIELAADAEFAVRAHGSIIEVRVPRIAPLLAKAEPPRAPAAGPPPPAQVESPPGGTAVPQVAAAAPSIAPQPKDGARQNVAPLAVAAGDPALPGGGEAAKRADPASQSESQKRGSLPTVALVGARATPPPPAQSAAERKRRQKEERVAAYAAAQSAAAEKSAAAQKAARGRRLAAADKSAAEQRGASERAAPARNAARERKRPAVEKAPGDRRGLAMAAPRYSITGIGFRPVGDGEVVVRSDHPLEYGVSAEGNAVVLHLASAAIPLPNNRRPLDTHFFNGPVQRVVPLSVASGTDLRIELREPAEYQLAQSGGVLTVTFSVPR